MRFSESLCDGDWEDICVDVTPFTIKASGELPLGLGGEDGKTGGLGVGGGIGGTFIGEGVSNPMASTGRGGGSRSEGGGQSGVDLELLHPSDLHPPRGGVSIGDATPRTLYAHAEKVLSDHMTHMVGSPDSPLDSDSDKVSSLFSC